MRASISLVGNQRLMYERLVDRDVSGALAGMYRGALKTFQDAENPERIPQAAHSLRELMEKLAYNGFSDESGNMGDHTGPLKELWLEYKQSVGVTVSGLIDQRVGPLLMTVLQRLDVFMDWIDRNRMSGRTQAQRVLEELKASGFTMPPEQQKQNISQWMSLRTYFVRVAHHKETDEPTFRERLSELENFLLALWMPDTAGDFAELDQITGTTDAE
jgi:hypothetical protein